MALPLLMASLFWVTELLRVLSMWEVAAEIAVGVITAGYCHIDGDLKPVERGERERGQREEGRER